MMTAAIYGSRRQFDYREDLRKFLHSLILSGVDIAMDAKLYDHLSMDLHMGMEAVRRVTQCPEHADIAISIGGDGTFLRTVAWVGSRSIPLLGINTGHLGYLAAITLPEAIECVDKIVSKDFRTEYHTLLEACVQGIQGWHMALNEVVVAKEDSSSMITAAVTINGQFLADYKADGLIISTPTGSTAYNLSVGGPIVQPGAPVWVMTPIAAHSLGLRPMVLDNSTEINITVTGRGNRFRLVLDGRATSLPMGTALTVRRAPQPVAILQRKDRSFAQVLTTKLMFNV